MKDLRGKKVLILGAARQGLALARFLLSQGAQVILNDRLDESQMETARQSMNDFNVCWALGGHPIELLDGVDMVCLSGGVPNDLPIINEARRRCLPLSNDTQIFMEIVPCPVVGITGSAGKTTTTTLVGRIAQAGCKLPTKVWVGGNIGLPLVDQIQQISKHDLVILEISSFQLELMTISPQVGAILNITPNHLDRHNTLEAYAETKARLIDFQSKQDRAVLGRDDPGSWNLASRVSGNLISFGLTRPSNHQTGTFLSNDRLFLQDGNRQIEIMKKDVIQLRGQHNLVNVLAACAIAHAAGIPTNVMTEGVARFTGVPHRLEYIRQLNGSKWYNDSIATAPERTIAAIRAFEEPIVLLLGGRDKKLPWQDLADLIHQRVDHVIVFGEAASKILNAIGDLRSGSRPYTIDHCLHLSDAVTLAAGISEPGDVVLLAPGGTSFDEFHDFEERGERFREWVKQLS